MISTIGLATGLGLLIYLTIRSLNILAAAPLCAAIVSATSGVAWLPPLATAGAPDFVTSYMAQGNRIWIIWRNLRTGFSQ
ncbi:MAG: hypothetical protein ACE5FO_12830, partial [Parvularculaceae bacterium]